MTTNTKIYVDLDGVLADFAVGVQRIFPGFVEGQGDTNKAVDREMWKRIRNFQLKGGEFWLGLPLMPDATQLWTHVSKHEPEILTACGNPEFNAGDQKLRWVANHFGSSVKVNLVRKAVEKAQFAVPGAILIDDKMKAIQPWRDAGGVGILHTSAASTIFQLKTLGL